MTAQGAIFRLLLSLTLVACQPAAEREFFSDNVTRVNELGLEDQYRIFRYGNEYVHPPMLELADPIARRGKTAIPFLMAKLQKEEGNVINIIHIFDTMQIMKTYDLRTDDTIIRLLKQKIQVIKSTEWRALGEDMLDRVEHPRPPRHCKAECECCLNHDTLGAPL